MPCGGSLVSLMASCRSPIGNSGVGCEVIQTRHSSWGTPVDTSVLAKISCECGPGQVLRHRQGRARVTGRGKGNGSSRACFELSKRSTEHRARGPGRQAASCSDSEASLRTSRARTLEFAETTSVKRSAKRQWKKSIQKSKFCSSRFMLGVTCVHIDTTLSVV